jgi:acetyl esterase/lipase
MKKIIFYLLCFSFYFGYSQAKVTTYTYSIKGLDTLRMDVYAPKNFKKGDSLPVMLWMHGGGFIGGNRSYPSEKKLGEIVSEKGYLGVVISYRLTRKGSITGFGCDCPKSEKLLTFKNAAIDFLDAARFIYENKSLLGADTSKFIAAGSSAGAEGMLSAVFMKEYFVDDLKRYQNIKFSGVFSLAGAIVNADYITNSNALPSVFFHGTEDNLVPYGSSPHHFCNPDKTGYLMLDGSATIVEKLKKLDKAFYLYKVVGGKHELSNIPFEQLDDVFKFLERTVFKKEIIQTIRIIKI